MQEEQEEMIKTGKPEKRRPSGFKNGVIIGLVLGLLITGIGTGVGIRAYANLTNNYVIFGPQGVKQTAKDNVLDQAAIKKVESCCHISICITTILTKKKISAMPFIKER